MFFYDLFPAEPVQNSVECILCEFVMSELDKMLKKNSTEVK